MFIKAPKQGDGWYTFINPFSTMMWVSTLIGIVLGALIMTLTYKAGRYLAIEEEDHRFNYPLSLFIVLSSCFQQGLCKHFSFK